MATMGIDGLASGLDTTSLINNLMSLEARPQALLKTTLSTTTTFTNDLRSLNTAVAGIAAAAKSAKAADSLSIFSAKSSSASVTATANATATVGSLSFTVDQVASAQVSVSSAIGSSPLSAITIVRGGTSTNVALPSSDLKDVAAAINAANVGVSATRVSTGKDSSGTPMYRLQLTATETGAAGGFEVYAGANATPSSGTSIATVVTAAKDASITLWGDSAAAKQVVTSSTNTFADLLTGVDVTVSKVDAVPATVSVGQDSGAGAQVASKLVTALIGVFSGIAAKSAVSTSAASGSTKVTAGSFTGDSGVRQLKDSLLSAATDPVGGVSPSSIGISVTRDGTVTFDSAAFTAALQKDPSGTQAKLQELATRVEKAATAASDPYDGYLTKRVSGNEAALDGLNDQISGWDLRLANKRELLQKQYATLETTLSSLNSQSSWLTSQLANL